MPEDIQRLRCKVNFQALSFVPHIRSLGDAIVSRLRYPSGQKEVSSEFLTEVTETQGRPEAGKFVVLHLRFDKVGQLFYNSSKIFPQIFLRRA